MGLASKITVCCNCPFIHIINAGSNLLATPHKIEYEPRESDSERDVVEWKYHWRHKSSRAYHMMVSDLDGEMSNEIFFDQGV